MMNTFIPGVSIEAASLQLYDMAQSILNKKFRFRLTTHPEVIELKLITIATALFLLCVGSLAGAAQYEPCGIRLDKLSQNSGNPGDVVLMYGKWGKSQQEKLPRINKGRPYNLEVIHWGENVLKVRVPAGLVPGSYKIGVYCNDPYDPQKGGSYSTGWVDFTIKKNAEGSLDGKEESQNTHNSSIGEAIAPRDRRQPKQEHSQKNTIASPRDGRGLSKNEAFELIRQLEVNPDDLSARAKLLGFYFYRGLRELGKEATIQARRRHVLWVITNHPESDQAGMPEITIDPQGHDLADERGYEIAKQLWNEQIVKHQGNSKILQNAARFVELHDKDLAESYLKQANVPAALGMLYAQGVLRINMTTHTGLPAGIGTRKEDYAFAKRAKDALDESSDSKVLSAAIHILLMQGVMLQATYGQQLDIKPVEYAADLIRKLEASCPDCASDLWPRYYKTRGMMAKSVEDKRALAKQELQYLEASRVHAQDPANMDENNRRFFEASKMENLLVAAFAAGEYEKAENYANQLLASDYVIHGVERKGDLLKGSEVAGGEIHKAHIVLGRIALKRGEIQKAKEHLINAGRVSGSPTLRSFGPNMALAKELLEHGGREVVLEYLELCKKFWDRGQKELARWSSIIKDGGQPDFGANMIY